MLWQRLYWGAQIASLLLGRKASLFNIAGHVVGYAAVDSVHRVKELADGLVVVEGIDDQGNVFAHVAGDIVVFGKKLRGLVIRLVVSSLSKTPSLWALSNFSRPSVKRPKVEQI